MTSLLDVWDQLPKVEKEIIGDRAIYKITEMALARYAMTCLLEKQHRKYFTMKFNNPGRFKGIYCKSCDQLLVHKHATWCAVPEVVTVDTDYVARFLSDLKLLDRPPVGWYGGGTR